jgi:hypothetical protein
MDELLIGELIDKTTVKYEILCWINTPDDALVKFIEDKRNRGVDIKIVGSSNNIGMVAFIHLFKVASYDMIVQLDDDVTVITPKAAEICAEIFARYPKVGQIVSDVWQDEYTSGAHPGMNSYTPYAIEDGLYDGPIDGGFSVYHRSIMPLIMRAPYQRYFYLGAWIRGALPSINRIGVLCKKIKIFHVYGAPYASAYNLFNFEKEKFKSVGLDGIARGFIEEKLPPREKILANIEKIKVALSQVPKI